MKLKKLSRLLCVAAVCFCMAGCQANSNASNTTTETEAAAPAADSANESTSSDGTETAESDDSLYGQVTAVDGNTITLALAEKPSMGGGQPGGNAGQNGDDNGQPPELPEGETGGAAPSGEAPSGEAPSGEAPSDDAASGDASSDAASNETASDNSVAAESETTGDAGSDAETQDANGGKGGDGQGGGQKMQLTLTGEEQTITIDENTTITKDDRGESTDATIDDITEDTIITVVMDGDTVTSISIGMGGGGAGGPGGDGSTPPDGDGGGNGGGGDSAGASTGSITLTGAYTVDGSEETSDGQTYDSAASDENAVLVSNGGSLTLTNGTLSKSGDSSSADESNFYAVNAVFAAAGGSTASISDTELTSDSEGSNAIFATGEGSVITADNVTIHTTGNSSRGLDATYGGTVNATNVTIDTEGAHCAPIATDRGEGTITVDTGSVSAQGDGSPCIYSTGDITASNVTGTAADSQCLVVEGKNSVTIDNCDLTGVGANGLMLYQSTSGDAGEGTASLTATDCTLTSTSDGPMMYITNTDAEADFTNTQLSYESGILVQVSGNDTNNWGTAGSNGGDFTLTGTNQTFEGDITVDEISTIAVSLSENSTLTGAINNAHTGKGVILSLDDSSTWNVTDDSYITALTDSDSTCANIISNGHTVYYDATDDANAWLNGQTIDLAGGGTLTPAE